MAQSGMRRREFLRRSAVGAAALMAGVRGTKALAGEGGGRPNVVLVLVDDMGFSDAGCYGGEIETPNIDRLAARGLRFSQFYNTAKCGPTRVCLMTGLYHHRAGRGLQNGVSLGEALGEAGYFTAATGKWHLHNKPTERGFDRYFGHLSGATNYWKGDKSWRLNGKKWDEFGPDFYSTDADTDYAIRFLKEAGKSGGPFFLYLAYNAPHAPLQAPRENVVKYFDTYAAGWDRIRTRRHRRQMEMGLLKHDYRLPPRPDYVPAWDSLSDDRREWEAKRMAAYAGTIDWVDQNLGRLVEYLENAGELDNTLLLFLSDNGASPFQRTRNRDVMPWKPRCQWRQGTSWANVSNTPLRWYKQNQHEGGISTPLIVHWPAGLRTEPGAVTHQPGHLIDVMPTLLEAGGASYPDRHHGREIPPCQGRSLMPVLRGRRRRGHRALFFQFSDNRAIRRGRWKLASVRGGPWELYDLEADRTEMNNLVREEPDLAAELKAQWYEMAEHAADVPKRLRGPVEGRIEPWDGHPSHPTK